MKTENHTGNGRRGEWKGMANGLDGRELAERYLPLVDRVVGSMRKHLPAHADLEELRSVGVLGLMQAVQRYTEEQAKTFEGYAVLRIRGAILDELRRMDWMPRTARHKLRGLREEEEKLEQRLGRAPTEEELRTSLELDVKEYWKLKRETQTMRFTSLDGSPLGEESEAKNLHEVIADDTQKLGSDVLEDREAVEEMVRQMEALPERARSVLVMYYKEGMRLRGFDPGHVRPPQRERTAAEKKALRKSLENLGVI